MNETTLRVVTTVKLVTVTETTRPVVTTVTLMTETMHCHASDCDCDPCDISHRDCDHSVSVIVVSTVRVQQTRDGGY